MGLMAFGANETPIKHIGLADFLIFLCQELASPVWPALVICRRNEGLGEFRIL